jgi:5-methyltetrahydrofolate--homocysteine methyltransferase
MEDLEKLYDAVVEGNAKAAAALTQAAVDAGVKPEVILGEYMIPAMDEVGARFEENEYFVPELLIAARAMKAGVDILRPLLAAGGAEPVGRVAIGTVRGDLHDIGKNLVATMLEGGGFEIVDVGVDASPEKFIEVIKGQQIDIIALSALLTTTMPAMKLTIDRLKEAGLRDKVKVIVGGAPVTQDFAEEIGADGYTDNAGAAVNLARSLIGMPTS